MHAFAVFAFAAYYAASGERSALARAEETVAFVRERLRDSARGGYFEGADEAGVPLRDAPRRQNPHMHWLEALLALHASRRMRRSSRTRARWSTSSSGASSVRRATRCASVRAGLDAALADVAAIEPGHHYEWTWLLLAHRELGERAREALAPRLFAFAERHGLDRGLGVFDRSRRTAARPLDAKRLWPQTERVKALAARGDVAALQRALDALFARYARKDGGWIEHVDRAGRPVTELQNATSVYHVTLALREAAGALEAAKR